MDWPYLIALGGGYLLGSVPFGLLLTRLAGMGDIRAIGSGNIGATNVLRTGNKALAAATLILDGGKGAAAALIGAQFGGDTMVMAAVGAIFGHIFPIWLGFKGGKGVATFLGTTLALDWMVGLGFAATWLAVAAVFRISSLAALIAVAATPVYYWLLEDIQLAQAGGVLAILIWYAHRENIGRLLRGQEPRIGAKKEAPSTTSETGDE